MTSGKPLNTLLKFSLPLLAGSVIQNLYNIFDTAIVGHVLGKYALAAVGNSYVPTLIINSIVLGIASGISIVCCRQEWRFLTHKMTNQVSNVEKVNLILIFFRFNRPFL